MEALKWLLDNQLLLLGVVYALINLVNAVLLAIPGKQEAEGWVAKAKAFVDRVSLLTAKGDPKSLKLPLSKSKK